MSSSEFFLSNARRASASTAGTPAESSLPLPAPSASAAPTPNGFASAMARALDHHPAAAPKAVAHGLSTAASAAHPAGSGDGSPPNGSNPSQGSARLRRLPSRPTGAGSGAGRSRKEIVAGPLAGSEDPAARAEAAASASRARKLAAKAAPGSKGEKASSQPAEAAAPDAAAPASAGDAPTNIIPFPIPSVIIPFPGLNVVPDPATEGDGTESTGAGNDAALLAAEAAPGNPAVSGPVVLRLFTPGAGAASTPAASLSGAASPGDEEEVEIDVAWPGLRAIQEQKARAAAAAEALAAGSNPDPGAEAAAALTGGSGSAGEPVAGSSELPANIERIEFQSARDLLRTGVAGPSAAGGVQPGAAGGTEGQALTQLPGNDSTLAKNAGFTDGERAAVNRSPRPDSGDKWGAGAGSGVGTAAGTLTGIPAAQEGDHMDLLHDSSTAAGAFLEHHERALESLDGISVKVSDDEVHLPSSSPAGPAGFDWQGGRAVAGVDQGGGVTQTGGTASTDAAATVDRISQLVLREAPLVRHHVSGSMAVMLRPDENTELFVHFTQEGGQLQATIRCERGDFHHLNALWPQLQESLAQQKISLAPLEESSSAQHQNSNPFNPPGGSGPDGSGGQRGSGSGPNREDPSDYPGSVGRPRSASTPASGGTESATGRGRGDSGNALSPGRPGWETWA